MNRRHFACFSCNHDASGLRHFGVIEIDYYEKFKSEEHIHHSHIPTVQSNEVRRNPALIVKTFTDASQSLLQATPSTNEPLFVTNN